MGVLKCLMNNKLEDIAPQKEEIMPLEYDSLASSRRSPRSPPAADRFHRKSCGNAFHELTVTTPPTAERTKSISTLTRSGRGNSVIDVFRGMAKMGKRDSVKQRSSHTPTRSSIW